MTPKDSDGFSESDWDDSEDLGWSEFDWEKYLRSQDDVVSKYLSFYDQSTAAEDRIDLVAQLMGWDEDELLEDDDSDDLSDEDDDMEPYTLQRNPVFIAARALYSLLVRRWESQALASDAISKRVALLMQGSIFRGEYHALLGIQSLDLGDYTMAISLFKRSMKELNITLSFLNSDDFADGTSLAAFREQTIVLIFDLREVLLRVISECRDEVSRHSGSSEDDDSGDKSSQA